MTTALTFNIDNRVIIIEEGTITVQSDGNIWTGTHNDYTFFEKLFNSSIPSDKMTIQSPENQENLILTLTTVIFGKSIEKNITLTKSEIVKPNIENNLTNKALLMENNKKLLIEYRKQSEILEEEINEKTKIFQEDIQEKTKIFQKDIQEKTKTFNNEIQEKTKIFQDNIHDKKEICDGLKKKIREILNQNKTLLKEFEKFCDEKSFKLTELSREKLRQIITNKKFNKFLKYNIDLSIFTSTDIVSIIQQISVDDFNDFVFNILNINVIFDCTDLIHLCCHHVDNPDFIQILINKGADIETETPYYGSSKTPLGTALRYQNYKSALFLLNQNADITINGAYVNVFNHRGCTDEIYQAIYDNAVRNNKLNELKQNKDKFGDNTFKSLLEK